MIQLPKLARENDCETCKCSPICKNRRRKWKGMILKSSAELLLDKQLQPDCKRIYPQKVHPNSQCPLFGEKGYIKVQPIGYQNPQKVIRICQTPIDGNTNTTCLNHVELAKKIGAWKSVSSKKCAFCKCGRCCICNRNVEYVMRDPDRSLWMRSDMKNFDRRVRDRRSDGWRNMYNL